MANKSRGHVIRLDGEYHFPRGFTISDNRIEDELQRFLTPAEYVVWRQYLRFWGSDKKNAYPSLAYLSEVTGLAERTIRKCNKGLVNKKYLKVRSGKFGKCNSYLYLSVEDILSRRAGKRTTETEEVVMPPIQEIVSDESKALKFVDTLNDKDGFFAKSFLSQFKDAYKNKMGFDYVLDNQDAKSIVQSLQTIRSDADRLLVLIQVYFVTKNKFIDESDRSIYFFFRPKVMKILVSEYAHSDVGRWEAQVEKLWSEIIDEVMHHNFAECGPEELIKKLVKFSGANKTRDDFVVSSLANRIRKTMPLAIAKP